MQRDTFRSWGNVDFPTAPASGKIQRCAVNGHLIFPVRLMKLTEKQIHLLFKIENWNETKAR